MVKQMAYTYVVTGGTSGIGASIVRKILETSEIVHKIIVNYGHNDEQAKLFMSSLKKEDREKIVLMKADLSRYDEMIKFVDKIGEKAKKIDYLVCNIGISAYTKFDDYTMEIWNDIINTNLTIPVFLVKELKKIINKNGSILMMGSFAGKKEYSSSVVYSISKAGILFLAKVLVKELEDKAIRINAIAPGFIETPWQKNRVKESYDKINRKIALHRFGKPEEVADIAYSVLTNGYMNGSIVDIHGGYEYF